MSFLGKIGGALKHGVHELGGLAEKAAPVVGMIPGVGTLAGGAIGGLGALAHGDGLKGMLKSGAMGALSGYGGGLLKGTEAGANAASTGGSFLSKVGGVLKSGAGQIAGNFKNADGSLDLAKLVAAGGAGANMIGQAKQRKSSEKYNNARIDQSNSLMQSLLAPKNYNLPQITPNSGGY